MALLLGDRRQGQAGPGDGQDLLLGGGIGAGNHGVAAAVRDVATAAVAAGARAATDARGGGRSGGAAEIDGLALADVARGRLRRHLLLHDVAGAEIDALRPALAVEEEGRVVDDDRYRARRRWGDARRERLTAQEPFEEAAVAAVLRDQLLVRGLPACSRADVGRPIGRNAVAAMGEGEAGRRDDRDIRRFQHLRGDEHAAGLLRQGGQVKEGQQGDGRKPGRTPHDGSPEAGCERGAWTAGAGQWRLTGESSCWRTAAIAASRSA